MNSVRDVSTHNGKWIEKHEISHTTEGKDKKKWLENIELTNKDTENRKVTSLYFNYKEGSRILNLYALRS